MINKRVESMAQALQGIKDGDVLLIGGFGTSGQPTELLAGVLELGARDLTLVANNTTMGNDVVADLMRANRVKKCVCSFPRGLLGKTIFDELYGAGKI